VRKADCKNFTESVITEIRRHGWKVHVSMVQLAGFNTTQFTWGRTKLPKQTKPVPPFYQPEIAAMRSRRLSRSITDSRARSRRGWAPQRGQCSSGSAS